VRVDHCVEGTRVPPHYDTLIAKVIVHGDTRDQALDLMRQSLDKFEIEGIATTLPFDRRLLRDPQSCLIVTSKERPAMATDKRTGDNLALSALEGTSPSSRIRRSMPHGSNRLQAVS
jgi:acetyl/propionyl-CoA carboxylase alpha subunit